MYTKNDLLEFSRHWINFDRSTAFGCGVRNNPYDKEICELNWKIYQEQFTKRGIDPPRL